MRLVLNASGACVAMIGALLAAPAEAQDADADYAVLLAEARAARAAALDALDKAEASLAAINERMQRDAVPTPHVEPNEPSLTMSCDSPTTAGAVVGGQLDQFVEQ